MTIVNNFFAGVIFASILAGFSANADPYQLRHRSFGTTTADIGPLFDWWQTHDRVATNTPSRPLPKWKLIKGRIVETKPNALIIEGVVFAVPRHGDKQKVFLYNPPIQQVQNRQQLVAERVELQKERRPIYDAFFATTNYKVQKETHAKLDAIDKRLQEIDAELEKTSGVSETSIEWFALDTGKEVLGMPMFDCGQPSQ